MFAHLVFNWWDRVRSMFEAPDPIVEVECPADRDEIQLHLGGEGSPSRADQPALRLSAFVNHLLAAPKRAAAGPMLASLSFGLHGEEGSSGYVVNVPTKSVTVALDPKERRVILRLAGTRLQESRMTTSVGGSKVVLRDFA